MIETFDRAHSSGAIRGKGSVLGPSPNKRFAFDLPHVLGMPSYLIVYRCCPQLIGIAFVPISFEACCMRNDNVYTYVKRLSPANTGQQDPLSLICGYLQRTKYR